MAKEIPPTVTGFYKLPNISMNEENTNNVIDLLTKYNPISYLTQTSIDTLLNRNKPTEASNLAGLPVTDVPFNPIDNIGRGIASLPYAGTQAVTNMLGEQPSLSYPSDAARIYQAEYGQPIDTAALAAIQKEYPDLVNWFTGKQAIPPSPYSQAPEQPLTVPVEQSMPQEATPEQQVIPQDNQPANVDKWTQAADALLNNILNPQQQQQDPVVQNAIQLITDRLSSPTQVSAYDQIMQDRTLAALQNADLRTQELEAQRSMNPLDYLSWGLGNVVSPIVGRPTTTREAFMDRKYAQQQQDIDQDYARATGQAQTLGQVAGDENKNVSDQIRGLADLLQLRSAATNQAQQQPAAQLRNLMLAKELVDLPARQQLEMQLNELRKDLTEQQIRALKVATDQAENPPPDLKAIMAEVLKRRLEEYGLTPNDAKAAETMKLD